MASIIIATDGSCIQQGNFRVGDDTARPGACGFVAQMPDGSKVARAEPHGNGTIGAMEVKALLMGLQFAEAVAFQTVQPITIKCDSQYAVNGYNDWLKGWAAKGYSKKGGLANADDWRVIDGLKHRLADRVRVEWVRGHNGDPLNEMCDQVVNGCARSQRPVDETARVLTRADADRLYEAVASGEIQPIIPPAIAETYGSDSSAPTGGLLAQAAELLNNAANDPRLAAFLSDSLAAGLKDVRLTQNYESDVVDRAQILHAALNQRSQSR